MNPPPAHAGHWLVDLLYVLPFVAFMLWLLVLNLRARRGGGGADEPGQGDQTPPTS